MKAMLLAAGLGTRLMPLTADLPKPMMPVLDRPALAHIVEGLERQGTAIWSRNSIIIPTPSEATPATVDLPLRGELLGIAGASATRPASSATSRSWWSPATR